MGLQFKRGFMDRGGRGINPFRLRYGLLLVAVVVAGVLVAFSGRGPADSKSPSAQALEVKAPEIQAMLPAPGQEVHGETGKDAHRVSVTVARGDTFVGILRENGISQRQALDIMERAKGVFDLSGITAGNELTLIFGKDDQTFLGLEYEIAETNMLAVCVSGDEIVARTQQIDRIVKPTPADDLRQVDLKVRRGDSIYSLLQSCGIGFDQIHSLFSSTRREYDLRDIAPGHPLKIWVKSSSPGKLEKLTYDISPVSYLEVLPRDGIFKARTRTRTMDTTYERAQGTITDSLYDSAVRSGLSPEIVMDLTDIFGWDINFFTDINDGDTFTVLYEKYGVEGKFKGYGRVVAARFMVKGEEHLAVYFDNGRGVSGYYDEHGKPIRKLFLKAPLNYRRISSGFSYHRVHPVFHVRRPHLGVDYAAPSGTPVVALGEGRITACGWARGFGRAITVKHPGGYVTHYGHLSRFAKGISRGKRVDQGDVIGYVGMTGIATGPHLDFRVQRGGKYINPLHLEPVNGPALRGSMLARFKQQSLKGLTLLDDPNLDKTLKVSKSG
jgi:murein DD-endopeptidase MepM/ murein hydrolase activator NlpD